MRESPKIGSAFPKAGYLPYGTGRALSPWSPDQNKMLDSWTEVNPRKDYFGYLPDNTIDGSGDEEYWDDKDDNDYEDWTRVDRQGPPS